MDKKQNTTKIIIVDDHQMIRDAWKRLISLHEEYEVIADVKNGKEAIEIIRYKKADIILMDISMPVMNGIEATRIISKMEDAPKIIALTMHSEGTYIDEMMEAGAKGYVYKDSSPLELLIAIDDVMEEGKYLSFKIRLDKKIQKVDHIN